VVDVLWNIWYNQIKKFVELCLEKFIGGCKT